MSTTAVLHDRITTLDAQLRELDRLRDHVTGVRADEVDLNRQLLVMAQLRLHRHARALAGR